MTEKRYGAGQGHPDGWTLQELKGGWDGMQVKHVALCCFDDLIKEVTRLQRLATLAYLELRGGSHVHLERQDAAIAILEQAPFVQEDYAELREKLGLKQTSLNEADK